MPGFEWGKDSTPVGAQPAFAWGKDSTPVADPGVFQKAMDWLNTKPDGAGPNLKEMQQEAANRDGAPIINRALGVSESNEPDWLTGAKKFVSGLPGAAADTPSSAAQDRGARFDAEHPVLSPALGLAGGFAGGLPAGPVGAGASGLQGAAETMASRARSVQEALSPGVLPTVGGFARQAAPAVAGYLAGQTLGHGGAIGGAIAALAKPGAAIGAVKTAGALGARMAASAFDKIASAAANNPAALGRFGAVLAPVAHIPQELAARSYALAQVDPEYQSLQQKLTEK